jgi:hypothetical protein
MGFYAVAVYYNKTQHTNNTPHSNKITQHTKLHKNIGHTTHNECNTNTESKYKLNTGQMHLNLFFKIFQVPRKQTK